MTSAYSTNRDFTFRPRGPRFLAMALMVLAVAAAVAILWTGSWYSAPAILPVLVVGYAAWVVFWLPRVEVNDAGVTLINPLQTLRVPWSTIILVDTKYALSLVTPKGRFTAWAAPAPSVISALRDSRRSARSESRDQSGTSYVSIRPGDQRSSDSGVVADIVRRRLARMAEDGDLDLESTESLKTRRSIHWIHLTVLLILIVLSLTLPAVLS
ncbi:MAG: PH domain-containing protein [Arthrobacter sp.]|uniref:PH domain-containing protein n=1 Tax=unclassified Arthrobacter TaxID=235627 RepID=UPI002656F332|nr:PH domain-containing protein [Micrococcaceae bacterium]MDN5812043.1 PH domain-containing protein [Micrococcaceae bacterium]MDN5824950.1 PH domain-containing protein [Micrococcaceae bacterium]MDN5879175.1 PH domain-containing protein [Micrococcaceae bacterium]MDN5886594.1 PH domain-containing protein [Micrococcaceae bacterium]